MRKNFKERQEFNKNFTLIECKIPQQNSAVFVRSTGILMVGTP